MRLLIILLLFPLLIFAQKGELKRGQRELKDSVDFFLPIKELIPKASRANVNTSWHNDFLKITPIPKPSTKVIFVIFDTAGELEHEAITNKRRGKSFTNEPLRDGQGHGTHVAGIIGATSIGVARHIDHEIYPYKVLNNFGGGTYEDIIKGTLDASNTFIPSPTQKVIFNYSLGSSTIVPQLDEVFKQVAAKGITVVAAAGNTGNTPIIYPARSQYAVAIGAIDQKGRKASFSSWGPELFMAAPGVDIYSTYVPGNSYAELDGTSMAAPAFAGLFGLAQALYPEYTATELLDKFKEFAIDIEPKGKDFFTGFGYITQEQIQKIPKKDVPQVCTTPQVKDIKVIYTTPNSIEITSTLPAIGYSFRYRKEGDPVYTTLPSTTNPLRVIQGLEANTVYQFQLQVTCFNHVKSLYSVPLNVRTELPYQDPLHKFPKTYQFELNPDSIFWKKEGAEFLQVLKLQPLSVEVTTRLYEEQAFDYVIQEQAKANKPPFIIPVDQGFIGAANAYKAYLEKRLQENIQGQVVVKELLAKDALNRKARLRYD